MIESSSLCEPVTIAGRRAQSRVVFGPHETNLGQGRSFSDRHTAYYARRAAGGAGLIVTEVASVHESDWPYERSPLATDCGRGWSAIVGACRPYGTLVLAGIGHDGLQGSSAYSQRALWAPSPFADASSRELPMQMEQVELDAVVGGFAAATRVAVDADLDGVEVDAGPTSLLRQFHSGLTNLRQDGYGQDKLLLTKAVLQAVRTELGSGRILSLRLSCDELAPWAGVTPEQAVDQLKILTGLVDLLVVVRGGPYSVTAYRPDAHTPAMFNVSLCTQMHEAVDGLIPVVLQGSVVDPSAAQQALDDGVADLVEMTRAQIADAELVAKTRAGGAVRPCVLCNQKCRVRDNRNPILSCIADPRSGHETIDADPSTIAPGSERVVVVGGGPAGMETARVLAEGGHQVRLLEKDDRLGGALRTAAVGPGRQQLSQLTDWLEHEIRRLGVTIETGHPVSTQELDDARAEGFRVILATGSVAQKPRGAHAGEADSGAPTAGRSVLERQVPELAAAELLRAGIDALPAGPVVISDPIGGPIGVGMAEWLAAAGREVAIVVPDQIVGTQLSLTGDLADANSRLQRAGVVRELRVMIRQRRAESLLLEDVWTGKQREISCAVLIDCGPRLPEESLYLERPRTDRVGDCVAPRSVYEAILEARRMALQL